MTTVPILSLLVGQTTAAALDPSLFEVTFDIVLSSNDDDDILERLVGSTLGFLYGLQKIYNGTDKYQKYALVRDTPTERVRSIALGRTELEGTAQVVEETVDAPVTGQECLYADWEIEEYTKSGDNRTWSTLETGSVGVPFYLEGDTGKVLVDDPTDATATLSEQCETVQELDSDTIPATSVKQLCERQDISPTASNRRRYTQRILEPATGCYVLGEAVERDEPAGPRNQDRIVIQRDRTSDRFIISDKDEEQLATYYRNRSLLLVVGGLALSAFCLFVWLHTGDTYGFGATIAATVLGFVLYGIFYALKRAYRWLRR